MNRITSKTTEKFWGKATIYSLLSFCLCFFFLSWLPAEAKVLVSGEKKNVTEKSRRILPPPVKDAIKVQEKTRGDKKYKIAFGSDEVEIGDPSSRKFKPQVKINRWGQEAYLNVEVAPASAATQNESVNLADGRVGWEASKIGAGFYKTGKREVKIKDKNNKERVLTLSPNGGFEFEVILYERPPSNVISLPIQSKGLKFYYQKPLTDAEKAQGIIRPDEVAGSYAVYHESKKDGKYGTGKAFQIYRPKIVDANGQWVWGQLNLDAEKSVLTVTIDDNWLESAAYPVVVDPEFGYTSIGASAISLENILRGTVFTAFEFTPTAITAYLENTDATNAHTARYAIYKNSDGQLIGSTEEVTIPAGGKDWYSSSYLSAFTLSAQEYALVANADSSNLLIYFDDGEPSSGQSLSKSKTYSLGWSDTLTDPSYDDKIYSICGATGAQISVTVTLDATAPTNQDAVFGEDVVKKGDVDVTVSSSEDATNNIWFAPAETTNFVAGATMTTATGTATTIKSPVTEGEYKLFVIDAAGNVSEPSTATLTVDATAPINQNAVFTASVTKFGGASVAINSSGNVSNEVWFAPLGTSIFAEGVTMTKATSGTATTILAPTASYQSSGTPLVVDHAYSSLSVNPAGYTYDGASRSLSIMDDGSVTFRIYTATGADASMSPTDASITVIEKNTPDPGYVLEQYNYINKNFVFYGKAGEKGWYKVTSVDGSSFDFTPIAYAAVPTFTNVTISCSDETLLLDQWLSNSGWSTPSYKLYVIDVAGNISDPSTATLTVNDTIQNVVFAANTTKKGGASVTIVSSGDAMNNIWFAPSGTSVFVENSIMTKAASGTATTILAPSSEWVTYATAGTTLTAGNTYANLYLNPSGALYNGEERAVYLESPASVFWTIGSGPGSNIGITSPADMSIILIQDYGPSSSGNLYLYLSSDISQEDVSFSKGWYLVSPEGDVSALAYADLPDFSGFTINAEFSDLSLINEVLANAAWTASINGYKLYVVDAAGNRTAGSTATLTVDSTGPAVAGVSSTLTNGTYTVGQVIPITVTFDEAVTVTGTPQLSLATGYPAATAVDYVSGSGTTALLFNYTVALGNESTDLDYSGVDALTLNGGTMTDSLGNAANLTLAAPGASGSLGANKAIVIPRTFLINYTVKDSLTTETLSGVTLTVTNSLGEVKYYQTKAGVFDDIQLGYGTYTFQAVKDAYVTKSEIKIPTTADDIADGVEDNVIHWIGYLTSSMEATADYQVKSSFVYVEPVYESDGTTLKSGTDVLNIRLWLERRGKMITNLAENKLGDATVEIYDDANATWQTLTFNAATDPGQNDDFAAAENARIGFYQKTVPYITTDGLPKLLTLTAGKTYYARCKIPYGGTTADAVSRYAYQGGTTFTIAVSEKLKELTDTIKTQVLNTQTLVSSEAATTRSAVTTAQTALEGKLGTEADSIRESIAGVKEETAKILTATGTEGLSTKIDEIKTQVVDEVKPFVKSGIITRENSVKTGSAITIRYRTETGLAPKLNVYSPSDVLLVNSQAMKEVGTTGIYESSVTFLAAWGIGDFSVVCSESTKGTVDAVVISVKDVDISDVSGNVSAVLGSTANLSGMNKIVADMGTKFTDVDKLLAKISTDISGKLGDAKSAANDMVAAFKQIEDISKQIKELSGGTGVNLEKLFAVSQDKKNDITYIKNKSEELKAAMELNQKLMQGVANKPVVETWFEYK